MKTLVDDGDTAKAIPTRMNNMAENIKHEDMIQQANNDPPNEFGKWKSVVKKGNTTFYNPNTDEETVDMLVKILVKLAIRKTFEKDTGINLE